MRKWRPSHKCIYVIPEVRGNMASLEIILNRIFPFRIFKTQEDSLVMLGNYIDGAPGSDKIIDCLINLKKEYGDRITLLKGFREELLLNAINSDNGFDYWITNGGMPTINDYILRANLNTTPESIKRNRLSDLIPKQHIDFLTNLEYYKIIDSYCFLHSGFNPAFSILENNIKNFVYDNLSGKYIKQCIKENKQPEFKDDYVFVVNSNPLGKRPAIHRKYFMLGGMAPARLLVMELNSVEACAIKTNKERIYKYNINIFE